MLCVIAVVFCIVGRPGAQAARADLPAAPPPGFVFEVSPTANARYKALGDAFVNDGRLARVLPAVNATLRMPRNIPVRLSGCGASNAVYDPNTHSIWLCYELFDEIEKGFDAMYAGDPAAGKPDVRPFLPPGLTVAKTMEAMLFIAMHEIGHALIRELQITYSGKEEDTVDEFATVLLLGGKQETIVVNGAISLWLIAPMKKVRKAMGFNAFFDEHAFGEQRYADILCLLYGSNPAEHAAMVPIQLPAARAASCENTYLVKTRFWDEKLAPHRRKP
jgi:hypothetical protein